MADDLAYNLDDYLKQQKLPAQGPTTINDYVSKFKALDVAQNPQQAGENAYNAYVNSTGSQSIAEQAGAAAKEGYQTAVNNNTEVNRQLFFKQQDQLMKQQQAVYESRIQNAQNPNAPQKLPAEEMNNLTNAYVAMDDIQKMKRTYQMAAGVQPGSPLQATDSMFGNPINGHLLDPDALDKVPLGNLATRAAIINKGQDPKYIAWQEQQNLTKSGVLNGVLNYTPGAEAKANVQPMAESLLPDKTDTPIMAYNKVTALQQKVLSRVQAMKSTFGSMPGQDTGPIDSFLATQGPRAAEEQQWLDGITSKANTPTGSTLNPATEAAMRAKEGKPPISPSSQFSPQGGATPMPAAPQVPQTAPAPVASWPNNG